MIPRGHHSDEPIDLVRFARANHRGENISTGLSILFAVLAIVAISYALHLFG